VKKNLVLIGFMGTGKSSIGKYLADKLGKKFVELDEEIVKKAGKSIPAIFAEKGETFFRQLEAEIVCHWSTRDNLVISTGGGVVLNKANVINLRKKGLLICLQAEAEIILQRVESDNSRPLLAVEDRLEKIKQLLQERASFYAIADYTIDTSSLNRQEVAEHLIGYWKGWLDGKNENCSGEK